MAHKGPCSGGCRGLGRAGHPHLPAGASSQDSSHATPLLLTAAAHGHGRGGRKRNRGNLARGLFVEQRLQEKGGPTGLLGSLGPHPWLFEAGQPNHHPCHWSGRQQGSSWVPDPGCLAQRAHRAGPILTTSEVLGSFPWLFVPILASRIAAHRKASTSILKRPALPRKGILSRARGVSIHQ